MKTQRKGGIEIQREEETQREDRYPEKVRDKQGQGWGRQRSRRRRGWRPRRQMPRERDEDPI